MRHSCPRFWQGSGQVLTSINALGDTSTYSYDNRGNRISVKNERGKTSTFTFDDINRNIQTTFPDLTTVSKTYDGLSRMVTQTDQAGRVTTPGQASEPVRPL